MKKLKKLVLSFKKPQNWACINVKPFVSKTLYRWISFILHACQECKFIMLIHMRVTVVRLCDLLRVTEPVTSVCAKLFQSCPTLQPYGTIARQDRLSRGFSRQECWRGLPCRPPGDLPNPGINPSSVCLLRWQEDSLAPMSPGKPNRWLTEPECRPEDPFLYCLFHPTNTGIIQNQCQNQF